MNWTPTTPEEQVLFLRNVQRLLAEGQFTASYKFALLLALADLAVVQGDDSGAPLCVATEKISEKFVEYYWRQCRPYMAGGRHTSQVLKQNTDRQAAIITAVIHSQQQVGASLFQLQHTASRSWRTLVTRVNRTVCGMPLWRLQTVGNERLDFLYDNLDQTTATITLKPGVAYCFRAFHGLLRDLIQAAWIRFVQKLNANELGNLTDLGGFLFGTERRDLQPYQPILLDIQAGRCFYCRNELRQHLEVDHFVPWSRYPTDLGHNFVLAHPACNNSKSDHIAAEEHLGAWIAQNREHAAELGQRLAEAALPHDLAASIRIAEWAYAQTEQSRGQVWVSKDLFRHLGQEWRRLLVA